MTYQAELANQHFKQHNIVLRAWRYRLRVVWVLMLHISQILLFRVANGDSGTILSNFSLGSDFF
jgi:hypothetical protein